MRATPTGRPEAFLRHLPPGTRGLVSALRAVVRRNVPLAEESVLWGGLSYHRPEVGGRVKGAVCQIVVKGGAVRLDFIHGIRLKDPSRLLRGRLLDKDCFRASRRRGVSGHVGQQRGRVHRSKLQVPGAVRGHHGGLVTPAAGGQEHDSSAGPER